MTVAISDSWKRMEDWLAEHAPATHAALTPPADSARIAEVERAIGRPLLRPLVASPARHDGFLDWRTSLLPGLYRLLSAREIVAEWRSLTGCYDRCAVDEAGDEVDDDFMRIGSSALLYGHPQVIPIARDMCGSDLLVDHRPVGDRGRVHTAEAVEGFVRGSHEMWTSLPVLMERVVASLETGRPLDGYTPVVDGEQRLCWEFGPRSL